MLEGAHLRAIQLLAAQSVVAGDDDYHFRFIFRWYSEKFHTPLHVVETIPLDDILQHYYESDFEGMDDHERKVEIERLLMTPDKLARLRRREDADDADAVEFGKEAEVTEASGKTAAIAGAPAPPDPIKERLDRARAAFKMRDTETILPPSAPVKLEEGIHMKFEDADVDLDDMPSFGPPEKPKG